MKRLHAIFSGFTLIIILLSINRLTPLTTDYLQPYDFLRILDFNAMIPIPLISIILYYLLKREIVYDSPFRKTAAYTILTVLLVSGIYLFGASSGNHEVTNYLNTRFCEREELKNELCNIVSFNDDGFSHIIYYLGFLLLNIPLILLEHFMPRKSKIAKKDLLRILPNAIFISLGIFANLAFEPTGLDLVFFGIVMSTALYYLYFARREYNRLPVTYYFAVAYSLGVGGTLLYKLFTA